MFATRVTSTGFAALLFSSTAAAIEPGLPSKTSIWAAATRAIGAKNRDAEFRNPDYLAIRFIGPRERAILTEYPTDALDLDFDAALQRLAETDLGFVTTMFARTRYIDDTMIEELDSGARQVVILGAGFDSRGYRFRDRLRGVHFFEVDYGPTQDHKQRRVKELFGSVPKHVRYVPMDFAKDDLLSQLRKSGYSHKERTLFIWEGVTNYIPESAVKGTLHFVRDQSAPGSAIIFNYTLSRNPNVNNPNTRFARWGEPVIFGFPGESATDYVLRRGLEVVSDLPMSELISKYARRSDGTSSLPLLSPPAGAVPPRFCVARVPVR